MQFPTSGCRNGHTYCAECYSKWLDEHDSCPSCRAHVSLHNLSRNLPLTNLIAKLPMKCKYHSSGCKWTGQMQDLQQHITSCSYKCSVCCPKCTTSLLLPHLAEHINQHHPDDNQLEVYNAIIQKQQLEITQQHDIINNVYAVSLKIAYTVVLDNERHTISMDLFNNLLQTMRQNIRDERTVLASCQTLSYVLYMYGEEDALYRNAIISNHGMAYFYECLERYIENHRIVLSVMTCLANISAAPLQNNDKSLVEGPLMKLLVSCMQKFKDDRVMERMICRTIRNYLQHEQACCVLVHSEGLKIILECNAKNTGQNHSQAQELLAETWYILGNLTAKYHATKKTISEHGAIQRAQETLTQHLADLRVADSVMWFLSRMICACKRQHCANKEVNLHIANDTFMQTVLQAMEKYSTHQKIQRRGVMLIENMIHAVEWNDNNRESFEEILNKAKFRIEPLSYKFAASLADISKELTQKIDHILEDISTAYKKRRRITGNTES